MLRNITVLLSIVVLTVGFNLPTAFSTVQPEVTKKAVKRIAGRQAEKRINKILSLGSDDLADGAVGTAKLDDEAVTNTKSGPGAVDTIGINDGAVTNTKLATPTAVCFSDVSQSETGVGSNEIVVELACILLGTGSVIGRRSVQSVG